MPTRDTGGYTKPSRRAKNLKRYPTRQRLQDYLKLAGSKQRGPTRQYSGGAADFKGSRELPRIRASGTRRTVDELIAARTTPSSRARARARFSPGPGYGPGYRPGRGGIGEAISETNRPRRRRRARAYGRVAS